MEITLNNTQERPECDNVVTVERITRVFILKVSKGDLEQNFPLYN